MSSNQHETRPGGTSANSPAFQRRVAGAKTIRVPLGRLPPCPALDVHPSQTTAHAALYIPDRWQPSLRDGAHGRSRPGVETPGYWQSFLRNGFGGDAPDV